MSRSDLAAPLRRSRRAGLIETGRPAGLSKALGGQVRQERVDLVFQKYALPKGELTYKGRKVNPAAIRRTALVTIEGERDDICAVGQTLAAQDLARDRKSTRLNSSHSS